MNTTKNNNLIAEFMGYKLISHSMGSYYNIVDIINSFPVNSLVEGLMYHASWDWLMPVVEKIEKTKGFDMLELQSHIEDGHSFTFYFDNDEYAQQRRIKGNTKLEATYQAVVVFIKWHNENK